VVVSTVEGEAIVQTLKSDGSKVGARRDVVFGRPLLPSTSLFAHSLDPCENFVTVEVTEISSGSKCCGKAGCSFVRTSSGSTD
jgi:hypothetical protein